MSSNGQKMNWNGLKIVFLTLFFIGLTTAAICTTAFAIYINTYIKPQINVDLSDITMNFSSIVYYEDKGTNEFLEYEKLHGVENRIWANLDEIPKELSNAFISIEDERFYSHNGVDWKRTIGAAVNWIIPFRSGYGGGSTLTQQLVKNITEEDDFSVTRKIKEILTALEVDDNLEKDQILEMYLNTIFLGRRSYGVKTAAKTYFGKKLGELNLAECAIVAGITKNPSYYDPFRFPEHIKERQELILKQMLSHEKISKGQYEEALATTLEYKYEENKLKTETPTSYFVDEIIRDVVDALKYEKGYSENMAQNMVYSGGLQIYSTVDPYIQKTMEQVFGDASNFPNVKGKNGALPQASMLVLDPYNGHVKGVIGGRGKKEGHLVLNRATQSKRSPGSAIKPISVYAPAIDKGIITPYSVLTDAPYNFLNPGGWPKNSTGTKAYSGQMTVERAVELSTNTIAVRVLSMLTPDESFDFMTNNLKVSTLVSKKVMPNGQIKSDIDLSPLALGGLTDGMTVKELTAAYAPFVNDGMYFKPITYTKVLDANGNVLLDNEKGATVAFENEKTSFYMTYLLKRVVTNGTGTKAKIANMDTAGKTGTTNEDKDRWFVGYTPYYVASCWFGYDQQQTVKGVGTNPALSLWKKVMYTIHKDLDPKNFSAPKDFVSATYCKDSGMKPTGHCSSDVRGSRVLTGNFYKSDAPSESCTLHTAVNIDSRTGMLATQHCPKASIKTISLLDLTRLFEKSIVLGDEQYTVHLKNNPIGTGVGPTLPSGAAKYSRFCNIHTSISDDNDDGLPDLDPEQDEQDPENKPGNSDGSNDGSGDQDNGSYQEGENFLDPEAA